MKNSLSVVTTVRADQQKYFRVKNICVFEPDWEKYIKFGRIR